MGVLPLLFQAVERTGASALEIVAWRTLFAVPFAGVLMLATGQASALRGLGPRGLGTLTLSASLIAANRLVYVWAITSGRTLEASLGYYINPLLNMAAGRLLSARGFLASAGRRSAWLAWASCCRRQRWARRSGSAVYALEACCLKVPQSARKSAPNAHYIITARSH